MRFLRRLTLLLTGLFPVLGVSQAYTTITSTTIQNGFGAPLSSGIACLTPMDSTGTPTTITPSGGSAVPGPFCTTVTAGAFTISSTPNLATAAPSGLLYTLLITASNGSTVYSLNGIAAIGTSYTLDGRATPTPPYPGQPSAFGLGIPYSTCLFGALYTRTNAPSPTTSGWVCSVNSGGPFWLQTGTGVPPPNPVQYVTASQDTQMLNQNGHPLVSFMGRTTPAAILLAADVNGLSGVLASGFNRTPLLCTTGYAPTGILPNGDATGCAPLGGGPGSGLISFQGRSTPTATLILADIAGLGTLSNSTSGNAGTATAFASTPGICPSGQAPRGVDTGGNVTGCQVVGGGGGTPGGGALSLQFNNTTFGGTLFTTDSTGADILGVRNLTGKYTNGTSIANLFGDGVTNSIATAVAAGQARIEIPYTYAPGENAPAFTAWANGTYLRDLRGGQDDETLYNFAFGQGPLNGLYDPKNRDCRYDALLQQAAHPHMIDLVACEFGFMEAYNIGHNFGFGDGLPQTGITTTQYGNVTLDANVQGIKVMQGYLLNAGGTGDGHILDLGLHLKGGQLDGSGEGHAGIRSNIHIEPIYIGAVVSVASTASRTTITSTCAGNCGSQGNGQHLLNKTNGVISATTTPTSLSVDGTSVVVLTGPTVAVSTCGTLQANVPTPLGADGATSVQTFVVNTTTAFVGSVETVLWGTHIEKEFISTPGTFTGTTQTLTMPLTYGYLAGAHICQGSVVGRAIVFPDTADGYSQWVLAVPSANTLTIGENLQQNLNSMNPGGTVKLYKQAITIDTTNRTTLQLDGLSMITDIGAAGWSASDVINLYNNFSMVIDGLKLSSDPDSPAPFAYVVGINDQLQGLHYNMAQYFNLQGPLVGQPIVSHSGWAVPPVFAFLKGEWAQGLWMQFAPDGAGNAHGNCVLCVGLIAPGSTYTNYAVFEGENVATGLDFLDYTPSSSVLSWSKKFTSFDFEALNTAKSPTFDASTGFKIAGGATLGHCLLGNGTVYADSTTCGFANPMSAVGDVIIGGTAGAPTRLALGGNGTFLGVSGGVIGYYTPSGSGTINTGTTSAVPRYTASGTTIGPSGVKIDASDNLTVPGSMTSGGLTFSVCTGLTSCFALKEVAGALTPTAGEFGLRIDSTTHLPTISLNGGAETQILTANGAQTITGKSIAASQINSGTVGVPNGGSGVSTSTIHGVHIGQGASAQTTTAAGALNAPLMGQGASLDPIFVAQPVIDCTNCTNVPAGAALAVSSTVTTVANTTTEAAFSSFTVGSGVLGNGNMLDLHVKGQLSSAATTLTLQLRCGWTGTAGSGTVLATTGAVTTAALTGETMSIDFHIVSNSAVGASTTFEVQGDVYSRNGTSGVLVGFGNAATVTGCATNASSVYALTATWAAASASSSVQGRTLLVNRY